ncbi:MAG: P-loop NTPase [Chloroflexi bacterium]|nr:P-loop NTPase [Chloroflexota bacterium]
MIIAIASGKGGTGKTTVATSLALSLPHRPLTFLDCDVEEPNAALFLRPTIETQERVGVLVPEIIAERCTYCGRCAEVCRYHAIAVVGQQVLVFREMCHGCGSCALNCPTQAIREVVNHFGSIELGHAGEIAFGQGILDVGQPLAPPIIRQLKRQALTPARREGVVIIDASPGTSCPVVESLRGADVALLVTEPTPFGLHDLRLAVEVARDELGLPVGVVINRAAARGAAVRGADAGDDGVERFCAEQGVPVWLRIPLDRRIAEAYSEGLPLVRALPRYKDQFLEMYQQMMKHLAASRVLRGVP